MLIRKNLRTNNKRLGGDQKGSPPLKKETFPRSPSVSAFVKCKKCSSGKLQKAPNNCWHFFHKRFPKECQKNIPPQPGQWPTASPRQKGGK